MMFSVDYPNASMEEARAFLDHLLVSTADRDKIANGNSAKLLRIK
jgi:hypothetical protein